MLKCEKGYFKTILLLAFPMMLQNLISFLVGFADNIMVGTLGESAISGVYLGNQLQNFLRCLSMGVTDGLLVLGAQYWGKKDEDSIRILSGISFRFSTGIGLLFFAATLLLPRQILSLLSNDEAVVEEGMIYLKYLSWSFLLFGASQALIVAMRSVEAVRVGMYASSTAFVVNVILNYVLIFGKLGLPRMGIRGAAVATLISRVAELAIAAVYVFCIDKRLRLRLSDLLRSNRDLMHDFVRYGAPIFAGQLVWGLNTTVQSALIGHLGASATSAVSITMMFFNMLTVVLFALSGAVGITTGKTIGAGKVEQMKANARAVQIMFLVLGLCCCGIIFALREPMLSLYGSITDETREMARQFMAVMAVTMIGTSYQGMCLGSLVKAGGDTGFVFKNDLIFVWLIVMPAAIISIYVLHTPAWVSYACLKADELLKCPVAVIKINRFRWMKNLTRNTQEVG